MRIVLTVTYEEDVQGDADIAVSLDAGGFPVSIATVLGILELAREQVRDLEL